MNCNDELSRLSCNLLYGRFKPKGILGGEHECGKEPNEHLGLLSSFNGKITNKSKKKTTKQIHTAIKLSGSLTITKLVVLPQFGSVFFRFFVGFFVVENEVIDMTTQVMMENIAPPHTFQIKKDLFKSIQPILRYSKNDKQLL